MQMTTFFLFLLLAFLYCFSLCNTEFRIQNLYVRKLEALGELLIHVGSNVIIKKGVLLKVKCSIISKEMFLKIWMLLKKPTENHNTTGPTLGW